MAYAKRACELIQRHHGRIAPTCFETADILLGEARSFGKAFLSKAFCSSKFCKIAADQLAHIHARKLRLYIL